MTEQNITLDQATQEQQQTTLRPTVPAIEQMLAKEFKVLDHGFIRVVDYMGNDEAVVQAARVSYGRGTKKANEDKGLINYLMKHFHSTPFEMCEIKFHIKLPIFIARQWIRHRTANVNEYSARYSILDKEFYIPNPEHLAAQSATNKQCRDQDRVLRGEEAARVLDLLRNDSEKCYQHYMEMLNLNEETGDVLDPQKQGLARELARMNLPLNYYTQWYWKVDLHNLLRFVRLRADPHAQFEIRAYAEVLLSIIEQWVPYTYEAFCNHQLNAVTLSDPAIKVIKKLIAGETVSQQESGMGTRDWNELQNILKS